MPEATEPAARLAGLVAALLAIEPRLGGALLLGGDAEACRLWIRHLRDLLGADTPSRRVPVGITAAGLVGGIDLVTSLSTGRRVAMPGVLAGANGGVLVVPLAELHDAATVSLIGVAVDEQEVHVERDGLSLVEPADFVVVAMTSLASANDDAHVSEALLDRLALTFELPWAWPEGWSAATAARIREARQRATTIEVTADDAGLVCATAQRMGISSLRAVQHTVRAARAHAALHGRACISAVDLDIAITLTLVPRARLAAAEAAGMDSRELPPESGEPGQRGDGAPLVDDDAVHQQATVPDDVDVSAIGATLSADFIRDLVRRTAAARGSTPHGRSGRRQVGRRRGRPAGTRPGDARRGSVDIHATLMAACPWSALRARDRVPQSGAQARPPSVRPDDIRIRRFVERSTRTIVFAVDASGSLARSRLAEAKGAIELLLAASYSRRDRACLIAFRGSGAVCLLPPTRALARARRELAAMPAGGATPLAAGLDLARETCERIQRERGEVRLVIVTDGSANVGRSGVAGRTAATADVEDAGRRLRRLAVNTLLIDGSPRGSTGVKSLAHLLGARLVHLGRSDARQLHAAVQVASGPGPMP